MFARKKARAGRCANNAQRHIFTSLYLKKELYNHMKFIFITTFLLLLQGCSSSSTDNASNRLTGIWQSNCHELTTGNTTTYAITNIDVTDVAYSTNETLYSDINCRNIAGTTSSIIKTYTIGEQVMTTDGVNAQRLTLSSVINFFDNPTTVTTENVFRVTGTELNLGVFLNGVTPSLDYAITYVKQ